MYYIDTDDMEVQDPMEKRAQKVGMTAGVNYALQNRH